VAAVSRDSPAERRAGAVSRRAFLALALASAVVPGAAFAGRTLWHRLREGNLVLVMRHAALRPEGEPPVHGSDDCDLVQTLSDAGRAQARRLRERLHAEKVQIARVYSSPACACRETAIVAFDGGEEWSPLAPLRPGADGAEQLERLRKRIGTFAGRFPGGNVVMVTHRANIAALTRHALATGEALVVRPDGCCGLRPLERLPAG
jgi:broad specificity phosphatase PhoE